MNEFESVSYLLMMFTSSVDETRKWMEMITMAQEEYRSLRSSSYNDFGNYFIIYNNNINLNLFKFFYNSFNFIIF